MEGFRKRPLADRLPLLTKSDWDEMIERAVARAEQWTEPRLSPSEIEQLLRAALGFTEVSVPSCFDKKYDA